MSNQKLSTQSITTNKSASKSTIADSAIIDWEQAKELMNGKLDEAKHLLKQLLNYLPNAQSNIHDAILTNDQQKLLEHVHKLHGACCYCGVPRLKQAAKSLELALRRKESARIQILSTEIEKECELVLAVAKRDKILNA